MRVVEFKPTILIIDDSIEDCEVYRRYLLGQNSKFEIASVHTAQSALDCFSSLQPDVILLDFFLPDADGLEFLSELRNQSDEIPPVIMLSGQGNEKIAVNAMKSGVQDYLPKSGLSPQTLRYAVNNALEQRKLQRLLTKNKQQQRLFTDTALRIRQSLEVQEIWDVAVNEILHFLKCDRVVIYKFNLDKSGVVVAESVRKPWKSSLGSQIIDTCFQETDACTKYEKGRILAVNDIYNSHLSECHIQLLEEFNVKANLVVPILTTSVEPKDTYQLWGLLIAHQCQDTREWEKEELEFLNKLSVQLSISIQQAELIKFLNAELGLRKLAELEIQKRATELESVNKQLIKATSLLQKRNQELDEFAYIVSHDLKAPLRGISNLCTWLEEDLLDNIPEENKEQLHLMRSRVFRMTNMIDDLLKYSRVGRIKNEKNKLNLISFLEEIIDSISPPPHFKVEIDKDMPQTINADAISLQQVLSNLISNAVKYNHRQDGQVKISIEDQNIHLKFTVADNGMGIQPEYHQKIFQIFQTLESKNNKESTGIGLAIVKKIVETQGGKIWIDSQLGEGTTFSFTWSK